MSSNEKIELYTELHRLERQMHRISHWGWHEHGHYREVSRLLRLIADNDGVMQRDLAFEMDVRPSSMTEMLSRMEAHGLVQRKPDEKDQRVMHIHLTEEGRKIAEESAEAMERLASMMFGSFTEEEAAQMLALTKKLCGSLDTMAPAQGLHEWHGLRRRQEFDEGMGPHRHGRGHLRF